MPGVVKKQEKRIIRSLVSQSYIGDGGGDGGPVGQK